jgi:hypothetical protein
MWNSSNYFSLLSMLSFRFEIISFTVLLLSVVIQETKLVSSEPHFLIFVPSQALTY